jgi:hypothetical protein
MGQSGQSALPTEGRNLPLPAKVVVSLRAGFVLAIANVLCVAIIAWAFLRVKGETQVISVTGSAKKRIESDLVVWRGKVSVNHKDLVQGYNELQSATDRTAAYLRQSNIPAEQVNWSAVTTARNYQRDEKGNATDQVTSYDLSRTVEITSPDVQGVAKVGAQATELIKEGVMMQSDPPRYLYTKLADLKVEMLAEATKDAAARARQIAQNSGANLGPVREARMGVMQINPVHSTDVSDSGNNDTTSLEKEITAIVSAKFELD